MGLFDSLRPSTFADPDPPVETRESNLELALAAIQLEQQLGSLDPETLPAIYAAEDLIAASIARLELTPDTPLSRRPDPFVHRFDFYFETAWSLAHAGDCVWLHTRTPRGIDSLEVAPIDRMTIDFAPGSRRRREYRLDGRLLDAGQLTHLRFHPRPGRARGLSPIAAARVTWAGSVAGERWGAELFASSGIPSGVLVSEDTLTKPEADKLRTDWQEARSGARTTAVLSGGVTYEGLSMSPADLAWLEHRQATALDVARIFHIPADMLEVAVAGSSLTYANLSEVGADFVRWCLDPYLTIICDAWATLPGEPGGRTFNTRPLYRASASTRATTLKELTDAGASFESAAAETEFDSLRSDRKVVNP